MKNIFSLTFFLALAYFSTGYFSNALLAIDGYAVASWPPSGIALAGFLLWQKRALPGIIIGALLVNLIHLDVISDILHWQLFLQAVGVAGAIVLQAWIGCYIIVHIIKAPLDLSSLKHSIQSLIIAGPVCCVIAASIGTTLLVVNNVIPSQAALDNFIAWWIGDSIGVLIFTPLLLAAFNYAQVRHRLQVIVPSLLIYALISISFYAAASVKKEKDFQKQEAKINAVKSILTHKLDEINSHLSLLATFFASSETVNFKEFKRFTAKQLNYSSEIVALEWVPQVTAEQLQSFVQDAEQQTGVEGIYVKELQNGKWQPVSSRAVYYPIQLIHPLAGNEQLLGYDLASNQSRFKALQEAKALNGAIVTEPVDLIQDTNEHYKGVLFSTPVFRDVQIESDFKGLVLAVVSLKRLAQSIHFSPNNDIEVSFSDITDPENSQLIYAPNDAEQEKIHQYQVLIGGRIWQIELSDTKKHAPWLMYWFAQIIGMLFVWLLITFLISVTGTNIQVREQVARQTKTLRQEKQKADQASRTKSQFLANMSHEVRTPINGIKGLHYLALQQSDWSQARTYIEQADGALSVLLRVLNDVLDFSKIEAGKLELLQEPVNVTELITEIENLFQFEVTAKSLTFTCQLEVDSDLEIATDPIRLKQVLLNLLNNAVKFTEQGSITLRVWQHDDATHFSVTDTGVGISAEVQQQLFQPFSQADSSTSRQYGGTGLGLSICKKLVELMAGEISLKSNVGQGSTFTFYLPFKSPLVMVKEAVTKSYDIDVSNINLAGVAILLVEDNPLNQHVASAILKTKGGIADIANDGFEAVAKVSEKNYDIILMDIQMPKMDGLQATKAIRNELMMSDIPIIGLSANAHDEDVKKANSVGMDDYLTKPIDAEKLFKTMWFYLSR